MAELSYHTGTGWEDLCAILKSRDVMVEQLHLHLTIEPRKKVGIILDGQRDITTFQYVKRKGGTMT